MRILTFLNLRYGVAGSPNRCQQTPRNGNTAKSKKWSIIAESNGGVAAHHCLNVLKSLLVIFQDRLETAQKAAYEAAGRHFQLTSPQQLSAILYDHLKLDTKYNISVKETDKRQSKSTSESMVC